MNVTWNWMVWMKQRRYSVKSILGPDMCVLVLYTEVFNNQHFSNGIIFCPSYEGFCRACSGLNLMTPLLRKIEKKKLTDKMQKHSFLTAFSCVLVVSQVCC